MKCYVINLTHDTERLDDFIAGFDAPMRVDLIRAIDGSNCVMPRRWKHPPGAFGLYATYLLAFTQVMQQGIKEPFAIFEDDAELAPGWWNYVARAVAEAPADWWSINLGADIDVPGYHTAPVAVGEYLARMPHGWRTHAVVYNPSAVGDMLLALGALPIPVDQVWCDLMLRGSTSFYCTRALIAGSRAGVSRITGISWDKSFSGPLGIGHAQHRALA